MSLKFYIIEDDYINFLRAAEIDTRGYSRVPNINKGADGTTPKFYCGIVLDINGISYFAPISSYNVFDNRNFMIFSNKGKVVSSVRFNYMLPVPKELLTLYNFSDIKDPKYLGFIQYEWRCCEKNEELINAKAKAAYYQVLKNHRNPENSYTKNSCDFPLLERKCIEHCIEHGYEIPHRCDYPNLKGNCFFVKCTAKYKEAIAEILTQTTSDITKTAAGYKIAIHNCHKEKVLEISRKHGLLPAKKEHPSLNHPNRSPGEPATSTPKIKPR